MKTSVVVAAQILLIAPAILFLGAVAVRYLPYESIHAAQNVVLWYTGRPWTLWVLLIVLPLFAVVTGSSIALGRSKSIGKKHVWSETSSLTTATLAAGGVLGVVVLHMLAN